MCLPTSDYSDITKRAVIQEQSPAADRQVVMMHGKRKTLKNKTSDALIDKLEEVKASIQAKLELPFQEAQMPVCLSKNSVSGLDQEHGATNHLV